MREFFSGLRADRKVFVFFVGTFVLTFLGPFGTYNDLTLTERLIYWFVIMTGVGIFMNLAMLMTFSASWFAGWPGWLRVLAGAVAAALPGAAIVAFVDRVFRASSFEGWEFLDLWLKVTFIGCIFGAVEFLFKETKGTAEPDTEPPALSAQPIPCALFDRLPDDIGEDVVSMSMQDHYVEVTTSIGNTLILLRLSDAMREAEPLGGLQIHRSHWVVRSHLRDLSRSGSRHIARLSDGRELPVSQTFLPDVQAILATSPKHR